MSIEIIKFKQHQYPFFQSEGFASKFIFPFAMQVCTGVGYDIGCGKEEWKLPGAIGVDLNMNDERYQDAFNLPSHMVDFIFSSHCLEHLNDWVKALDHWDSRLKSKGVLFLYLPDYSQVYWRPWNNRKHINVLTPYVLYDYMRNKGYVKIFYTGVDLNNSFAIMGEKP